MRAEALKEWNYDLVRQCIEVGRKFVEETELPVTFSRDHIYERLSTAFYSEYGDLILVIDGKEVLGAAVVYAVADYHPEKFGYVEKMFILPERRGVGAGRVLAEKVSQWFDDAQCVSSFATSTAGIGATGLFKNLMAKYGYEDYGPTLMRENSNGKIHAITAASAIGAVTGTT